MRTVLSERLSEFRQWSYQELAERAENDHDIRVIEDEFRDGTSYFIEIEAFWDGARHSDVRVWGHLYFSPPRKLLGFIPAYISEVSDSFIMNPDGGYVGE